MTPPRRPTDAALAEHDRWVAGLERQGKPHGEFLAANVRELVDEVRRLRAVVDEPRPAGPSWDSFRSALTALFRAEWFEEFDDHDEFRVDGTFYWHNIKRLFEESR